MTVKVLYHTMTGNTKKVAEAIARAAGIVAEPISSPVALDRVDLLFLGDGNYGSDMHGTMKAFIRSLDPSRVGQVAVFGTYGGVDRAVPKMKALLESRGFTVREECFSCRGKAWGIVNRSHPTEPELAAAQAFAARLIAARGAESGT